MSLRNRGGRRRIAKVGVTVFTLAAFQVLAVIGAGVTNAVTTCSYDSTLDKITITIPSTEFAAVAVEGDGVDIDPAASAVPGSILFSDNGGAYLACGSASITNTTIISVLGQPSTVESFTIDNATGDQFATTIVWGVDLGSGSPDFFEILASEDTGDAVVLTNTTFTINGGGGDLLGAEVISVEGNNGNDTIDGSALTSPVLFAFGDDGDDVISPGTQATLPFALGFGEFFDGGFTGEVNGDTLTYGTRTTSVVIDSSTSTAGHSANADCDVLDAGDEEDIQFNFENLQTGSANDCLVGLAGVTEFFIPGDGDDTITGQTADGDTLDWSSSTALMTITPNATCGGSATGQASVSDTWTGVRDFVGSAFDDVLIYNATCPSTSFSGGDGTDTVDASAQTSAVSINLDTLDPGTDDLENLLGGSGSDTLTGNDVQNQIEGNDGNDNIYGAGANDNLIGGLGNDNFDGGAGADTVSFQTNTTDGVNVDLSLGFATSPESGDDGFGGAPAAITGPVEIIHGSPFDDTITGGGGLVTINFLFTGGGGDDVLTGSGSNDTLKGGGGDDIVRAVEGDDTLAGAGGDDLLVGGPGFDIGKGGKGDDVCKKVESKKSCGTDKNPAKVQLKSLTAKLV